VEHVLEPLTEARLAALRGRLLEWLVESACPHWATLGVDPRNGGFVEALGADGAPLPLARRVRVQPRQVVAFTGAAALGWRGDLARIARDGMDYLDRRYCRADGLYRTLIDVDGAPLDDTALLYDHAFVLLGMEARARALDQRRAWEQRALELRGRIERTWRAEGAGFRSGEGDAQRRDANPHLHLLEACLAWAETGSDPGWAEWVGEIASLATSRLLDPASGAIVESFTPEWRPSRAPDGRRVEPGHQFEWAWLLLRCGRGDVERYRTSALMLIESGERHGVRGGFAVNALLDDGTVQDASARLWPQTERLKAALLALELTGDARHRGRAADAAAAVARYLDTDVPGLWLDERLPSGTFKSTPAPASSFYHVVGAIAALQAWRAGDRAPAHQTARTSAL
jgi:mannose/cellobiose epimerase-like protein (N-acyl-D-glucosamine 2-epimerase family)